MTAAPWDYPPPPRSVYAAFEAFPRPKGASSHIAAMVSALARESGPVWLFCCGYADMPALQVEGDIVIHRFKLHHPNLLRRAVEFGGFIHDRLARLDRPPEIAVFRDPWSGAPILTAMPDVPAVFEVNGLPSWELPATRPVAAGNPCLMAKIEDMERFCLRKARTIVVVSELTGRALAGLGVDPDRITLAPNSAADVFFQADSVDDPLMKELDQGRWFGYVGSLHPWQGVYTLVEAWALIAGDHPDVRLLLIHNGRRPPLKLLRKKCRKLGLDGRVVFQSPLDHPRLAAAISKLEFTTAPLLETYRNTHQGCCPVKIIESMAAGAPVLASDLAVTRALIQNGRDGLLLAPGRKRDWALGLGRMLGDPALSGRLAEAARAAARESFTREAMFQKLQGAFDRAKNG